MATNQNAAEGAITTHIGFGVFDQHGRQFGVQVTFSRLNEAFQVHIQRTRDGKVHGHSREPLVGWTQKDVEFHAQLRIDSERYWAQKRGVQATPRLAK